ncbi:unnamed protein product [Callosobruchus maculatus]|uniref:BUD13 homolog n=1 Tax=Callosobruchus maculatus TaxID=64391 RepID=A0A653CQ21_CALMS|nr:unnamed protein product [Callosobruchus maculatus]
MLETWEKLLKIVDDNIDVSLTQEIQEDIDAGNEDAPLIVAVIDDRPPSLRVDDTKNALWKPIGSATSSGTENTHLKLDSFKLNKKTTNETSLLKGVKYKNDAEMKRKRQPTPDASPPRKANTFPHVRVKQERISPECSPPRNKDNSNRDADISPPRKKNNKQDSDNDMTPPRKRHNKASDDDRSPPRRRDNDMSPPRKRHNKASDDDRSPPRRRNLKYDHSIPVKKECSPIPSTSKSSTIDMSPPRRKRNDLSPTRREGRGHSPKRKSRWDSERSSSSKSSFTDNYRDITSPRSRSKDRDSSPPRNKKNLDNYRERDVSPPRRKHKDSSEDRRKGPEKMERTMSGKKAGLQSAKNLVEEIKNLQAREDAMFKNMSDDVLGVNAATIVRKKKKEEDPEEIARKLQREQELKQKYDRWGKGLKQVQDETARISDAVHEMNKPLARYADDTDLERLLKEQEREGDPMLDYIRKKKRKKNIEAGVPEKPMYMGEFMPNRFGIRPGYRWDGVDRSNGYEKRWFEIQNKKKALQEEAHKWSTEDICLHNLLLVIAWCAIPVVPAILHNEFTEPLASLLSKLLNKDIIEDPLSIQLICKKCYKMTLELDELQNKVLKIKHEMLDQHKVSSSIEKTEVEEDKDTLVEETEKTVEEEITITTNHQNELQKKILFIPSSDDDSTQVPPENPQEDLQLGVVEVKNSEVVPTESEEQDRENEEDMDVDTEANFHSFTTDDTILEQSSEGEYETATAVLTTDDLSKTTIILSTDNKNVVDSSIKVKMEPSTGEDQLQPPVLPSISTSGKPNILKKKVVKQIPQPVLQISSPPKSKFDDYSADVVSRDGDYYTCLMCDPEQTAIGDAKSITSHTKQVHDVRIYICDVCGAAHEKTHEVRPRPFKCNQCSKSFLSQQNLTQHERTHLGLKQEQTLTTVCRQTTGFALSNVVRIGCSKEFACHLCDKTFGSAHNLEVHSIVHTGYKPFVCGVCDKAFARKAEIRDHERTHTGERPYQCEFCGATFSQRLTTDEEEMVTVNEAGEMELLDSTGGVVGGGGGASTSSCLTTEPVESKLYIQEATGDEDDDENGTTVSGHHIIINGEQFNFAESATDEENDDATTAEIIGRIEQVVAADQASLFFLLRKR